MTEAADEIRSVADPEANIIFGASFDERMGDEVMITVIATGFDTTRKRESVRSGAGAAAPGMSHSQRLEAVDYLADLDRQRTYVTEPVAVHVRSGGISSPSQADRQSVAVPIQTPPRRPAPETAPRRPAYDGSDLDNPQRRPAYDSPDIEIPTFLRRKAPEEEELV